MKPSEVSWVRPTPFETPPPSTWWISCLTRSLVTGSWQKGAPLVAAEDVLEVGLLVDQRQREPDREAGPIRLADDRRSEVEPSGPDHVSDLGVSLRCHSPRFESTPIAKGVP
jgi:hypothetical protein